MGVDNANVARRYLTEIWAKGNLDAIDELVDPNILLREPMTPDGVRGIDVFRERQRELSKQFTDTSITIEEVIVSGDRVVVRHTWQGKHVGQLLGIAPTNRTIRCEGVEVLRIANGKVTEDITYTDQYSMLQQLGAVPPPDELVVRRPDTRPGAMASTS